MGNRPAFLINLELQLQDEINRRRGEGPPEFKEHTTVLDDPSHPCYDILHKKVRYKVYHGGRGGLKSWAFAEAAIKRATHEPIRVLCTREYQNSIADSVHKLLKDTIERLGVEPWFDVTMNSIRSRAGAEFIFKGLHNNVKEIKSTEGIDICWPEEAQTISKESWEILLPTIRKDGSEIWISLNRENETDATDYLFIQHPPLDSVVHHINFDQNPFFPKVLEELRQEYLRRIDEADNDEERAQAQSDYDHVWLGETKKISNEVIFSGKYLIQEFDGNLWKKAQRLLYGADFGFAQDPSTLIRSFIYDNCLYIEYEAYGTNVEFSGNMVDGKGELEQFYDSVPESRKWPIKGDCSRPETISFIRGLGFNIQAAEKWQGSVEDGITHMRGFRKIIIHPRCKRTAYEFKNYKYKVDRMTKEVLPIIIDKNNHCIDAIRYSLDQYIQRRNNLAMWAKLGR